VVVKINGLRQLAWITDRQTCQIGPEFLSGWDHFVAPAYLPTSIRSLRQSLTANFS
jgi:hypothetical protein